jgi:TPR repeat protein
VELEPSSVRHRLTAARVFWRYDNLADARKAAQVALSLADTDAERADVQRLLSQLPNDSAGGAAPRQAAGAAVPAADSSRSAPDPNALLASCQRADMSACTTLAPIAAKACADGQKRACVVVAMLQARGSGVPKDEARAYAAFEQLCDGGLLESCAQWAIVLASHPEKPDLAKARQLLTKSCDGGLAQACDRLKSLPK